MTENIKVEFEDGFKFEIDEKKEKGQVMIQEQPSSTTAYLTMASAMRLKKLLDHFLE